MSVTILTLKELFVLTGKFSLILVLTLPVALAGTANVLSQQQSNESKDIRKLTLLVNSDRRSYLPGELITLHFKLLNNSQEKVLLPKNVDVWSGHLQVFVADQTNEYNQYKGPRWGLFKRVGAKTLKLAPGESFSSTATMLHNHRVETSHLAKSHQEEATRGLIKTEYAIPKPGVYFIKAVLIDDALQNRIESEPMRIVIEEPLNGDLDVWNKIKNDGNYARFIQTGALATPDPEKTKRIMESLEEIHNSQPNSRYDNQIRGAIATQKDKSKKDN